MEWMLVGCAALAWALVKGVSRGKAAVTDNYRKLRTRWTGSRPTPNPVAATVAAGTATAVVAGFLFTRAFIAGVREGWPKGAKRGRDWYHRREANRPPEIVDMSRCPDCGFNMARAGWPEKHNTTTGKPCGYDWSADPRWQYCPDCETPMLPGMTACGICGGALVERLTAPAAEPAATEPTPAPAPAPAVPTTTGTPRLRVVPDLTEGTPPMPLVETTTGGDVRTLEQAQAELNAIEREATADREDAQCDRTRAEEDAARYERFAAAMENLHFGPEIVAGISGLVERAQARVAAAEARADAADATLAAVRNVLTLLDPHVNIRDAAAAAGGLADREAYGLGDGPAPRHGGGTVRVGAVNTGSGNVAVNGAAIGGGTSRGAGRPSPRPAPVAGEVRRGGSVNVGAVNAGNGSVTVSNTAVGDGQTVHNN